MKIGLTSNDWTRTMDSDLNIHIGVMGGSGWIRLGQYARYSQHPVALGVLAWSPDLKIFGVVDKGDKFHWDCDIIVIQRVWHSDIAGQIKQAQAQGQIVINDIDDWYWGVDPKNKAFQSSKPKADKIINVDNYRTILAVSSYVTISTPYLAERLFWVPQSRRLVFPNYVETDKFVKRQHSDENMPIIGWVGSTAHRSGDLGLMRGVLPQLASEFRFHHTGAYPKYPLYADETKLPYDKVDVLPFFVPDEYPLHGFPFDIGIVPLKNLPFNHAKSWIKGIEYASAGIPFIASPLTEYIRLKQEYGVGRLAKNAAKWTGHFKELKNARIRQEEAERNLEAIKPLNIKVGAKLWDEMMESLI